MKSSKEAKFLHFTRREKILGGFFIFALLISTASFSQAARAHISLDKNWKSIAHDSNRNAYNGFEKTSFNEQGWERVNVPHNWDAYEGYRRKLHGNRHGYAWYRKTFTVKEQPSQKRLFLFFEGVGSYATVWLNGKEVGYHAGGRTSFTIDVTGIINYNSTNLLAVRADHPAGIKDLPWVCGGCSDERGYSEGSQPMGIFRPVHLVITNDVRIEPFGVHVWNDSTASKQRASLNYETEIKNYSNREKRITILSRLVDKKGKKVDEARTSRIIKPGEIIFVKQTSGAFKDPFLWSLEDPYLYTIFTEVFENGKMVDRQQTPYGIRTISWPVKKAPSSNQFFLNGKAVFINGIAEYEHLLGSSHAFSAEQVRARTLQMKAAGFNAFRDAHHPHNLRYQDYWDSLGLLWWTQMGAHVWYDTPEFRNNFKKLLKEWVKERRNSPSVVLWGLQNESKLPEDFARECTELVRTLDPTASSQRLVTTCNGGKGTDWDVPQNWTGTYGGNPDTYSDDIKRQILIGEYGAWRTIDLHSEGPFQQNGPYSEDRMTQLMEMKIRLGEAAKDSSAGHFMWLFTSHDNPGRVQGGEGLREMDRIGPVNYKGLLTPWEEPLDVFYMFRSNYASKEKEPMVYIVSHTWPNRWTTPGIKNGIVVYSNCDEVELFNDINGQSLGRRKKGGKGTHFQWDNVNVRYNLLYAIGYVKGKAVAKDIIIQHHLPASPNFNQLHKKAVNITKPAADYNYVYRVNCGGDQYTDENGQTWMADQAKMSDNSWGSLSWTVEFPGMPPFFASQRRIFDPVTGTKDWKLFQSFRYGRQKLQYHFPVQDGEYRVELYFTEPWWGRGGMNAEGYRVFDVALNDNVVINNLDIWKEAGLNGALKKTFLIKVKGGRLVISFPEVAVGQAVISAIAIASLSPDAINGNRHEPIIKTGSNNGMKTRYWMDVGDTVFTGTGTRFQSLPPELYGAEWIQGTPNLSAPPSIELSRSADLYVAIDSNMTLPLWLQEFNKVGMITTTGNGFAYHVYRKRFEKGNAFVAGDALSHQNILFMAQPATNMEPAYDLKKLVSYKAVNADISGHGIVKGKVDGKDRVIYETSSDSGGVEWNFAVGVADIYSLTISYHNPLQNILTGKMQLLSADGTLMKEEEVQFTPTRQGKSNYITTNTGSMINAGYYKVRLTARNAAGLDINALDVQ